MKPALTGVLMSHLQASQWDSLMLRTQATIRETRFKHVGYFFISLTSTYSIQHVVK